MNKTDFPILSEQVYNRPLVYLDNAATTQKPQARIGMPIFIAACII